MVAMFDRRESIYAQLGVPPDDEDVLTRWERLRPKPEPERSEPKLDIRPPTMVEIDELIGRRIAAHHQFTMDILAEVLAHLQHNGAAGPPGPVGPAGPSGPPGAPGKLPIAKMWCPDSVSYKADVVCYDGSLYQALKDTAQVPGGSDWICLAAAGRDACTLKGCGTYNKSEHYENLDVVALNGR